MANDEVIYAFRDRGSIPGIPARDLTQRDLDRLSLLQLRDVRSGKLYEPVTDASQEAVEHQQAATDGPDFEAMTKGQLAEYAADHNIEGVDSADTKAEMIAALQGGEG